MIDWFVKNSPWLSDLFSLFASISLFLPLIGLVGQSQQFRAISKLSKSGALTGEDLERARDLIIHQRFSDGQSKWLWSAGVFFVISVICLLISISAAPN